MLTFPSSVSLSLIITGFGKAGFCKYQFNMSITKKEKMAVKEKIPRRENVDLKGEEEIHYDFRLIKTYALSAVYTSNFSFTSILTRKNSPCEWSTNFPCKFFP